MKLGRVVGLSWALITACSSSDSPMHEAHDAGDTQQHEQDAGERHDAALDAGQHVFDAGSDPDRNRAQPGHLCARIAAIECAAEAACCETARVDRDREQCLEDRASACAEELPLDVLSTAAEVGFDVDVASTALAEFEHRAATCDPQIASWFASSQGLLASLAGTRGKNDSCEPAGDDDGAMSAALFSCQLSASLACSGPDAGWTCVPRTSPGASCLFDRGCADGLFCDGPIDDQAAAVCHERRAAGQKCQRAAECASFVCSDGVCGAEDDVQAAYCP